MFLDCDLNSIDTELADKMHPIAWVESSGNPYAIGVVGGHLSFQPKNLEQALVTVKMLKEKGYNYSVGLMQINQSNFDKYGMTEKNMFSVCKNVEVSAKILKDCHARFKNWDDAYRCYYSGSNSTARYNETYLNKIKSNQVSFNKGDIKVAQAGSNIPTFIARGTATVSKIPASKKNEAKNTLMGRRYASRLVSNRKNKE